MNPTDRPYVLHGFDVSYFTAKARVAMRYKQIFLEEKRALEERYAKLYAPLYAKRAAIVKGEKDVDAKPEDGDDADEDDIIASIMLATAASSSAHGVDPLGTRLQRVVDGILKHAATAHST